MRSENVYLGYEEINVYVNVMMGCNQIQIVKITHMVPTFGQGNTDSNKMQRKILWISLLRFQVKVRRLVSDNDNTVFIALKPHNRNKIMHYSTKYATISFLLFHVFPSF